MACACSKTKAPGPFVWTALDEEGNPVGDPIEYPTEIQAKARVIRKGGAYKPVNG